MAKTTAAFRLTKYAKRMIAMLPFRSENDRAAYKQNLIDGQVAASVRPKSQKTRDVNNMPVAEAE